MTRDQNMRREFEAWAATQEDKWLLIGGLIWSPKQNDYASERTNAAWAAWQAARASAPQGVPQQIERADMAFIMDELPASAIRARQILRSAILSGHAGLDTVAPQPVAQNSRIAPELVDKTSNLQRTDPSDEDIDAVFNAMPDGMNGRLKSWGYRQFARALLQRWGGKDVGDIEAMVEMLEAREWADHVGTTDLGERLEHCISELHNELHAAKRDAERYRWLRDNLKYYKNVQCTPRCPESSKFRHVDKPKELDAAIDAAMAAQKGQT